jgi:hypothetical protein
MRRRFETEPDFVNMKRFDYSLDRCREKHPAGIFDQQGNLDVRAVAAACCLDEEAYHAEMALIALDLRDLMDVEVEEDAGPAMLELMLAVILPRGYW